MQVGTLAVQHIFEKHVLYLVPLYQRPYVWTAEEQWQPLWEDLLRLAETLLSGGQTRAHFLGASVQDLVAVKPGEIETRLLIDGQQRLTTLQLLLKAFADVVHSQGIDRYQLAIEKLIRNDHPLSTQPHEAFKVWPTNADRDDFQAVMDATSPDDLKKAYGVRPTTRAIGRTIIDAYLFFSDRIADWLSEAESQDPEAKVAALYSAVRDNIRLVVIDLDEKDDAQLIFETLNARGTPLLAADLVKNALLNEVQAMQGENAEQAYQKYWQHFDSDAGLWRAEVGRGHAKRARIELFLQYALTLMAREEVSAGHLYTAYRDFAGGPHAGTPIDRLADFKRYGLIYRGLLEGHTNPCIQLFLERLRTMDVTTAYPFLIRLFDLLGTDHERLVATLGHLESFLVRRMVCRLSTRAYGTFFVDLLSALEGDPASIPQAVRTALARGATEGDRWPSDDEFKRAWVATPLFEIITRPRLRLLLEALEMGLRDKFAETQAVPKGLTVEHIMPQSWEMFWPLPTDLPEQEARTRRTDLIHTIGNLTLLNERLNPSQSNRAWTASEPDELGKREALQDHSVLFLNKRICAKAVWDEDAIQARAQELFGVAAATWPHPG